MQSCYDQVRSLCWSAVTACALSKEDVLQCACNVNMQCQHVCIVRTSGRHVACASEYATQQLLLSGTTCMKGFWASVVLVPAQVVRAPVALAMVKLLKLLPEEAMVQQLPQALQGVAHLLRNRLQRIRCDPHFMTLL